jgi:lipopolysaccharide/colanic/teichoic acid biosynthesis glycosyltransferase
MQRIVALMLLGLLFPIIGFLYLLVKLTSRGPFIFNQKRWGKNKKPFFMYKIRTMIENAEELKPKLNNQNEANGPVFKIRHDPRYTRIGKILSHSGIDEILQLINIVKGEMAFVGPRPLPIDEAKKVPEKYNKRFSVLPGITSLWVVNGAHNLTFDQWMQSDIDYINQKTSQLDMIILAKTLAIIVGQLTKIQLKYEKTH